MSPNNPAGTVTNDLRGTFLKSLDVLKRVKPAYKFNKKSLAYKLDVALQRYCNELRGFAEDHEAMQHAQALQPKDPTQLL